MAAEVAKDVPDDGADMRCEDGLGTGEALETARGAGPVQAAHQKPEVEGGGLNQDPFSNLLLAANVDATESSGLQQVGESPLQLLAPLAQQPLPPPAPDPPAGSSTARIPGTQAARPVSAHRHAIPRSEPIPSRYPTISIRKYTPGGMLGRPRFSP